RTRTPCATAGCWSSTVHAPPGRGPPPPTAAAPAWARTAVSNGAPGLSAQDRTCLAPPGELVIMLTSLNAPPLRGPAVALGAGPPGDLGHNGFRQAVGGDELDALLVHGSQAGLARGVDRGHPGQFHAKNWLSLAGQGGLPAILQQPHRRPCQSSLELKCDSPWLVVKRDSQHHSALAALVPALGRWHLKQGPCRRGEYSHSDS